MSRIQRIVVKPEHFTEKGFAEFRDMYRELVETVNALQGFGGAVPIHSNIDLNGNRIVNSGKAVDATDLLTQEAADPKYSTDTQRAAMEAVGAKMLQTTRRLNDGTQQHKISTDLNLQGSIPPTLTGSTSYTSTATSITVTFPTTIQFGDQSIIAIPNVPVVVTGLVAGTGFIYPYYDTRLGLGQLVADSVNATGVPPVVFAAASAAAAQAMNGDGRVPLSSGGIPVTIVGGGGGSGGGSGCIRAGMVVRSHDRGLIGIESVEIGELIQARLGWTKVMSKMVGSDNIFIRFLIDSGETLQVTPSHPMELFEGKGKAARDLCLKDLLVCAYDGERPATIVEMSVVRQRASTVLLTCDPHHDFLVGSLHATIVAHNFNLPK